MKAIDSIKLGLLRKTSDQHLHHSDPTDRHALVRAYSVTLQRKAMLKPNVCAFLEPEFM